MRLACRHCGVATKETTAVSWACWRCVFERTTRVAQGLRPDGGPIEPTAGSGTTNAPAAAVRACQHCGRGLVSRHARARFCSPACRVVWNRKAAVTHNIDPAPSPLRDAYAPSGGLLCAASGAETALEPMPAGEC
jgi:hypothetical protein